MFREIENENEASVQIERHRRISSFVTTRISLLLLALLPSITMGCLEGPGMPYELKSKTTEELKAFSVSGKSGEEKLLSDFTPFEWDRFYFVDDGTKFKDINKQVGFELFSRQYENWNVMEYGRYMQDGPLLVFTKDGVLVHAVVGRFPYCIGKPSTEYHCSNTYAQLYGKGEKGPYQVKLVVKEKPLASEE